MSKSFYGGMDGRPFILKQHFSTIDEMIDKLSTINYGDYVIIDTQNKNNPENGRIFRKTVDTTSPSIDRWVRDEKNLFKQDTIESGGMVYIGQIVGPSGNAPHLHFLSKKTDVSSIYGNYKSTPGYDVKTGEKDSEASIGNGNLVPGKTQHDTFNDKISWRWCSVRNEDQHETDAYIGFTIPYTVIEFDASSVNPYYERDNDTADFINEELVDRLDDGLHPFYQKWQINIPKGIHGQNIENLILNKETGLITYDIRNFDAKAEGISTKETLNEDYPLTWITGVNLDTATGKLDIETNNNENEIHENLTWVKGINLSDTGYLDIETTTENEEIHKQLQWVKNILFNSDNGTVTIIYVDDTEENPHRKVYANLIDWIKQVNLNTETGELTITSNNGDIDYSTDLTWVKNLTIGETGLLNTITTTGENQIENQQLQWVKDIKFNANGTITIIDVDGTERQSSLDNSTTYTNLVKWIDSIALNHETGELSINFNNGDNYSEFLTWIKNIQISDTGYVDIETTTGENETHKQLQWIKDIAIDDVSGVVTYTNVNNTTSNNQLTWVRDIEFKEDGTVSVNYTSNKETTSHPKLINWVNAIEIKEDGTVSVDSNTGKSLLNENQQKLKWPTNIKLTADGKVSTSYNDGTEDSSQNPQLYWITSASVDEIDADNDGNIDDIRLRINYNNSLLNNVDVSLKSVNDIEFKNGGIYAKYSTGGEAVFKGAADEIYLNVIAGAEGEANTDGLRVGGIWFVTEDPMPQAVLVHTANHEAVVDNENTPLKVWEE